VHDRLLINPQSAWRAQASRDQRRRSRRALNSWIDFSEIGVVADLERAIPHGDRGGVRETIRSRQYRLLLTDGVNQDDLV
jgi:hypothetical protein